MIALKILFFHLICQNNTIPIRITLPKIRINIITSMTYDLINLRNFIIMIMMIFLKAKMKNER